MAHGEFKFIAIVITAYFSSLVFPQYQSYHPHISLLILPQINILIHIVPEKKYSGFVKNHRKECDLCVG